MTRRQERAGSLVVLFAFGGWLIYIGFNGWTMNHLPAQYFGYILVGGGILGLLGVNIWYGGILDPRHDPPQALPKNTADLID